MTEKWIPILGFEGRYEVSDFGRVRSVARTVASPRHGKGGTRVIKSNILATQLRSGYPTIKLLDESGASVGRMVHRLVAEAFVSNPVGYDCVNHLDANRANNLASNLEWCNQSMNIAHSYRIGRRPVGSDHHFAKLPRDAEGRCLTKKAGGGWEMTEVAA